MLATLVDHRLRRHAERVGDQLDRMLQGDVHVGARHRVQPAQHTLRSRVAVGRKRWHAELAQRLGDELLVALGDVLAEVGLRALRRHLCGHDDVDAVWLAVGVLVHPVQDAVELVRIVEPHAAEHAHPAGAADRAATCSDGVNPKIG